MARTGLLVLKDLQSISSINSLLSQSRSHILSTLYVQPNYESTTFNKYEISKCIFQMISVIYSASDVCCPGIDVRVLLPASNVPQSELLLSDDSSMLINRPSSILLQHNSIPTSPVFNPASSTIGRFTQSCLGGTFDRLHAGHKILLSEACLVATDRAVIGLAYGDLLNKKLLRELIMPFETRKSELDNFINSIQNHLKEADIVAIDEPFGPSITDSNLQVMVLSAEVQGAINKINELRKTANLNSMKSHVINNGEMVSDEKENYFKPTETVSSSAGRVNYLGELLKPEVKSATPGEAYVIGITGMLASGKSSVCKILEVLGAYRLDADKLGHLAYVPKTDEHDEGPVYKAVIAHFGEDIVDPETKFVDRKKLGAKVFADPLERKRLEYIVWPAIGQMCSEHIQRAFHEGYKVIIIEAAVLLEAGWDKFVNEVWCVHVPLEESIKRATERDGLPEEQVRKRIASQIPLENRIERSNVVISTQWDADRTQKIVEKAWKSLNKRIS